MGWLCVRVCAGVPTSIELANTDTSQAVLLLISFLENIQKLKHHHKNYHPRTETLKTTCVRVSHLEDKGSAVYKHSLFLFFKI